MKNVSIDDMQWKWASVDDTARCDDCKNLTDDGPWIYVKLPTIPGEGKTRCLWKCRCNLVPALTFDLLGRISGESVLNYRRDTGDFFQHFNNADYGGISDLVSEYEAAATEYYKAGDWNLPDVFYREYFGLEERKKYLRGLIRRIETDTLTNEDLANIAYRNAHIFMGGIPQRLK